MDTTSTDIQKRVAAVLAEIAAACQRANRPPDDVTLVAVSKTYAAEQVKRAIDAGIRHLGENRIEEAIQKMPEVAALSSTPVDWHMVGHLQSRKARYVMGRFALLHSLDSVPLAERLSRLLSAQDTVLEVLLEVNVSGEAAKQGWDAQNWRSDPVQREQLWQDLRQILGLPGLHVRGLMTMAPIVEHPDQARPVFTALRHLRDALANDFPDATWADLSMGMSDDYPVAIEEGATLVRVGRAIFGERA